MRKLALLLGMSALSAAAQTATTPVLLPGMPAVPTTKILAIGSVTPPAGGAAAMGNIMPREVGDTVRLYLAGKIDQWYSRKDASGVVFVMNVTTVAEANELLEKLPLGVAGIMKFELIPMGPLSPLNFLLPRAAATPAKP